MHAERSRRDAISRQRSYASKLHRRRQEGIQMLNKLKSICVYPFLVRLLTVLINLRIACCLLFKTSKIFSVTTIHVGNPCLRFYIMFKYLQTDLRKFQINENMFLCVFVIYNR